jgi:hypothetical protein
MTSKDPLPILHDLLAGRIDAPEAARRLVALAGPAAAGLAHSAAAFSGEDAVRLRSAMPAVRWEMAKLLSPGRLPEVAYDSSEYHRFMAGAPSGPG